MSNLKEEIKNYYHSKNLSEDQIQKLSALSKHKPAKQYFKSMLVAASVIFFIFTYSILNQTSIETKIMREIALNHSKDMPIHIKTGELKIIQSKLQNLKFNLLSSDIIPSNRFEILGARYCKVQGNIAAQIKLLNKENNKRYTLYQTKLDDKIKSSQLISDKIKVIIWKENEILFGLAESMD